MCSSSSLLLPLDVAFIRYSSPSLVTDEVLKQCAVSFSLHYGVWGQHAKPPLRPGTHSFLCLVAGGRVRMSAKQLRSQFLFNHNCGLITATTATTANSPSSLVGHAFFLRFPFGSPHSSSTSPDSSRWCCWITQLCVASAYRRKGVASKLCAMALACLSNAEVKTTTGDELKKKEVKEQQQQWFACGLVSSNPFAIRAFENAAQVRCNPLLASSYADSLVASSRLPYVQGKKLVCSRGMEMMGVMDTEFPVEHGELKPFIEQEGKRRRAEGNCDLGELPEGHEFFAFSFPSLISLAPCSSSR